jgi:hypothetical protein
MKPMTAVSLLAFLALLSVALPLAQAQIRYNDPFFMRHFYGPYCTVDVDGAGQPFRCDNLNSQEGVKMVSLTGNNSPFILNNSYIYNSSVNVIFNGGAIKRWCNGTVNAAYGPQVGMYCNIGKTIPYFYIVKRYDLPGLGGPYLWPNNYFELIFQLRSVGTDQPIAERKYCGKEVHESIIHCDYPSGGINQTAFEMIYSYY